MSQDGQDGRQPGVSPRTCGWLRPVARARTSVPNPPRRRGGVGPDSRGVEDRGGRVGVADGSPHPCPAPAHRRDRRRTLSHRPSRRGRSRRGAPVRSIHGTALANSRLSVFGPRRGGAPEFAASQPRESYVVPSHGPPAYRRMRPPRRILSTRPSVGPRPAGPPPRRRAIPRHAVVRPPPAIPLPAGGVRRQARRRVGSGRPGSGGRHKRGCRSRTLPAGSGASPGRGVE